MTTPRPSVERFVRRVVLAELARRDEGSSESHVAQRIMVRLHRELRILVGTAGFDVLLSRALVLAQRSRPSLAGITNGPDGTLRGLEGAARDDDGRRRDEEAAIAIVSHFIELLVTLIGEDLAMRLVKDLWPANEEDGRK